MTSQPTMQTPSTVVGRPVAKDAAAHFGGGGGGWWKFRAKSAPYLFLSPYFFITLVFFLYPLCYATILAFYQTNGPARRVYVGLDNFKFALTNPDFQRAVWTTTLFTIASICIQLPLSLGLAMLLNVKNDRLKSFFRLAIFAPNLVVQVFVAILYQIIVPP